MIMADIEPALQPVSTGSTGSSSSDNEVARINTIDHNVEQLITEKLMKGYTLLSLACPSCASPLIKDDCKAVAVDNDHHADEQKHGKFPILVASESFEQPFYPVKGVPYCVSCCAHVVTGEADVEALESSNSLREKGSILVALTSSEEDDASRDNADPHATPVASNGKWSPPDFDHPNPADDDTSENSQIASDIGKPKTDIQAVMAQSERILNRNAGPHVDPSRISTSLFCGTTSSRQMNVASPDIMDEEAGAALLGQLEAVEQTLGGGFAGAFSAADADALADDMEEEGERYESLDQFVDADISSPEFLYTRYLLDKEPQSSSGSEDQSDDIQIQIHAGSHSHDSDGSQDPEHMIIEYAVRREIATKVLGKKMMEGYSLRDDMCNICGMPIMEKDDMMECVVCPVLKETIASAQSDDKSETLHRWAEEASVVEDELEEELRRETEERIADEQARLAAEEDEEANHLKVAHYAALEEARAAAQMEAEARIAAEEEARHAAFLEAELARSAAHAAEEEARQATLEAGNVASLLIQEKHRHEAELSRIKEELESEAQKELDRVRHEVAYKLEQEKQYLIEENERLANAKHYEKSMIFEEAQAAKDAIMVEEAVLADKARLELQMEADYQQRRAQEQRKLDEATVLEETRRLELEAQQKLVERVQRSENEFQEGDSLRKVAAYEASRQKRVEMTSSRIAEIEDAQSARIRAEDNMRQKQALEQAERLANLELDAEEKQKTAQEAIARAQSALSEVSGARHNMMAATIAKAEAEAIAEVEAELEVNDANSSIADIEKERWATLRAEGRSILTRRMMIGWKLNEDLCAGAECRHSPLVEKDGNIECVICGGTGSGTDGAYLREKTHLVHSSSLETKQRELATAPQLDQNTNFSKASVQNMSVDELKSEFESKRNLVSQEIGRKMMEGWTLLDLSCPKCVMPLMTDGEGGDETCVLCGPVAFIEVESQHVQEERKVSLERSLKSDPPALHCLDRQPVVETDHTSALRSVDRPHAVEAKHALTKSRKSPDTINMKPKRVVNLTSKARSNRTSNMRSKLELPTGVELDDESLNDLMSIAKAAAEEEERAKATQGETNTVPLRPAPEDSSRSIPTIRTNSSLGSPVESLIFQQGDADDDVSHMTGSTWSRPLAFAAEERSPLKSLKFFDPDTLNAYRNIMGGEKGATQENTGTSSAAASVGATPKPDGTGRLPPRHRLGQALPNGKYAPSKPHSAAPQTRRRNSNGGPPRPEESARSVSKRSSKPSVKTSVSSYGSSRSDDVSIMSEVSRTDSVASKTLDTIVNRIEECKSSLEGGDIQKQVEMANLIQTLATAAVALKKMEDLA